MLRRMFGPAYHGLGADHTAESTNQPRKHTPIWKCSMDPLHAFLLRLGVFLLIELVIAIWH